MLSTCTCFLPRNVNYKNRKWRSLKKAQSHVTSVDSKIQNRTEWKSSKMSNYQWLLFPIFKTLVEIHQPHLQLLKKIKQDEWFNFSLSYIHSTHVFIILTNIVFLFNIWYLQKGRGVQRLWICASDNCASAQKSYYSMKEWLFISYTQYIYFSAKKMKVCHSSKFRWEVFFRYLPT